MSMTAGKPAFIDDPMQATVGAFFATLFGRSWKAEQHAPDPAYQPGDVWNLRIEEVKDAPEPILRWLITGEITRNGEMVALIRNYVDVDRSLLP